MIYRYIKHLPKILNPLLFVIYFFVRFLPRDSNKWLFGSSVGHSFSDNAKYFYLYCSIRPEIKSYWITTNRRLAYLLRSNNLNAYYKYSIQGLWLALTSKIYIYDSRINGINYWLSNGAYKVALWHGSPLKTIDRDVSIPNNMFYIGNHTFGFRRYFVRFINPECFVTPNFMIASSDKVRDYFISAFGCSNVLVTGYPRNDVIISPDSYKRYLDAECKIIASINTKKTILYVPTFRDTDRYSRETPIDWEVLNDLMVKYDTTFLIKLHRNDYSVVLNQEFSNITVLDINSDMYPLFACVDLLITDYSSIFFDFLLTDKPVLFFPYDKNEYLSKDRSLYDDYDLVTPGRKAYNFKDLFVFIEQFLEHPNSYTNTQYSTVKQMYNKYIDGRSSDRVFNEIFAIIKES